MNKRILKLLKQASKLANTDDNKDIDRNFDMIVAEKFAELIVQECIDIIAPYSVRMIRPGELYLHPIQEIQQHFGVKE